MVYLSKKKIQLIIYVLEKEKKEMNENLEITENIYSQIILEDRLKMIDDVINTLGCQIAWGFNNENM